MKGKFQKDCSLQLCKHCILSSVLVLFTQMDCMLMRLEVERIRVLMVWVCSRLSPVEVLIQFASSHINIQHHILGQVHEHCYEHNTA